VSLVSVIFSAGPREVKHRLAIAVLAVLGTLGVLALSPAAEAHAIQSTTIVLTDVDLTAGEIAVAWGAPGSHGDANSVDVLARWQIDSGAWTDWTSFGSGADEIQIPGVAGGDEVAVNVRSVDRSGRSTMLAMGTVAVPADTTLDTVGCIDQISVPAGDEGDDGQNGGGRGDDHDRRLFSLAGGGGRVALPRSGASGVRLTTRSGAAVTVGLPRDARHATGVRVSSVAVEYRGRASRTYVAALPAGQANPCAPTPDPALIDDLNADGVGVEILTVISGAGAPTDYAFPVDVPVGGSIVEAGTGFQILDATGTPIVGVDPPEAVDANGNEVATSATLSGSTLEVHVAHDASSAYPIVLDPEYRILTPTALDTSTVADLSGRQEIAVTVGTGAPGGPKCTVYVDMAPVGSGTNLRMRWTGRLLRSDCTGVPPTAVTVNMSLEVCMQVGADDGLSTEARKAKYWPTGRGSGPCRRAFVGAGASGAVVPPRETPCRRPTYWRAWVTFSAQFESADGRTKMETEPKAGPLGGLARCLAEPTVDRRHIFQPDGSGNAPSGWHWRVCDGAGVCNDPPNVQLNSCLTDPSGTGVYGCYWQYKGFTVQKYSTFFPKSYSRSLTEKLIRFAYTNAEFLPNGGWISPFFPTIGYAVRGSVSPSNPDVIRTAYPNRNLRPDRKINMAGCGASGGMDVAGGPSNDNFDSAQLLTSDSDVVTGTLQGASAQPDEPGGAARSVWYCWKATTAGINLNTTCWPANTASFAVYSLANSAIVSPPPRLSVWTGSDFDSLQLAASGIGGVAFAADAGSTYLLQVSDPGGSPPLPTPPAFELVWPTSCA